MDDSPGRTSYVCSVEDRGAIRRLTNGRWKQRVGAREGEVVATFYEYGGGAGRDNLVRVRGVGILDYMDTAWRRAGMTEEEERREATRWWIRQAGHLGILSSSAEDDAAFPPPQHGRMEYVLKTRVFSEEKERAAKREQMMRRRKSREVNDDDGDDDDAERLDEDGGGSSLTPEAAAVSSIRDSEDEQSSSSSSLLVDPSHNTPISNPQNTIQLADDDDDAFKCTICLTEIEDGDRVGVLPCNQIFHADCLTQWIMWRNACPLCQGTEIGTVRSADDMIIDVEVTTYGLDKQRASSTISPLSLDGNTLGTTAEAQGAG
eukprot:CAMPEP_0201598994 /NCGR_PEP_ID=MMETSP0492-20130828/630_1 /ASSEMBLY_ACC=CAM_ASM_000837 /TAXON_ID=420259 /ORGANISM="Thalassiosira gravida, Strain GMp14c1" /LENGTH=317 /DNA_ID=CAMNT_0048061511 /DNA_START=325 /DNA_END=1280 /DNA_ORIENTATION=+